ncbi:MAG: hypothetical protein AAF623_15840 [Planctomycetota bacterium]
MRTIETRDLTVTYSNNTQVLNAIRQTIDNPTIRINDAIRDLTGNILEIIDPNRQSFHRRKANQDSDGS